MQISTPCPSRFSLLLDSLINTLTSKRSLVRRLITADPTNPEAPVRSIFKHHSHRRNNLKDVTQAVSKN